jgi:hypothetical protein
MARSLKPPIVHPPHDLPAYSDHGVDLTLIRWMLSLTPGQRLRVLQQNVDSIHKMRRHAAKRK